MKEIQPRLALIEAYSLHIAVLSKDQGEKANTDPLMCVSDDRLPICKEVVRRRKKANMIETYSLSDDSGIDLVARMRRAIIPALNNQRM